MNKIPFLFIISTIIFYLSCKKKQEKTEKITQKQTLSAVPKIVQDARNQIGKTLYYDPAYTSLRYPMGDVSLERGVCTDVIIRALRN